ncbi:ASPIC and UnbV [Rosistilla ulvae]|uniref:ASPIC and UnbV n=1 Tax=Rosistilla ulvae TaxID=1930277 RepID=A0A517LXF0_9BACT|nr:FG-GAP-like repeat-containing protein [Rosistilla ulvae]QDS87289.1 ASPIC and UnbV [Rosistilla ulvae]
MKKRSAKSRRAIDPPPKPTQQANAQLPRWLTAIVAFVAVALLIYCVAVLALTPSHDASDHTLATEQQQNPKLDVAQTLFQAEQALREGHVSAAEEHISQILESDPANLAAINRLAYILGVEGRCWEANRYLFEAVRRGQFTLHHLVLLGALEPVIDDAGLVQRCRTGDPDDLVVLVGAARTAMKKNQMSSADSMLQEAVAANPSSLEGQAWLGRRSLAATDPPVDFATWQEKLPANADSHPEIWITRGQWARENAQPQAAIRCFLEAARLDPNHRIAHLEAGQLFGQLNKPEQATAFLDRAEQLRELGFLVDEIFKQPENQQRMLKAADLTEALGRPWEAWAWCELVRAREPNYPGVAQSCARLRSVLTADSPQTLAGSSPVADLAIAEYPLPNYQTAPVLATSAGGPMAETRFAEMAQALGIDFTYKRDADPETGEMRMLETTGGGVAIVDYDADGWPDVYFTQSAVWPSEPGATQPIDRLFRNLGGKRFVEVAVAAGVGDDRYSQGVTAGDYNNDGFADLYVANFGRNRLYRNNGDGTFTDVSDETGIGGEHWTTSCLLADVNGDGFPDLYDVNYLSGDDAARSICRQGDELRWCSPSGFAGDQDQLFLNDGKGRFENVTSQVGIELPEGKGLGIVAADFDDSGRLSLFVANDAVANFFFVNAAETPGVPPQFLERAILHGLAFDGDGLPQACMGVAIDDANNDGRLDLFVTNFHEQANTLYRQQAGAQFVDATRRAGLFDASYQLLGFGTQFLDGDLDGSADLVVANGHVLDLSAQGIPFAMRPQYFQNDGTGRFRELKSKSLGDYFAQNHLGRGLALLDWNRDGKEDFVVSNIGSVASFNANTTTNTGHYISVNLHGVNCSRDAIGAKVTLQYAGITKTRQLTAGSGYQASNQRQLIFGIGDHPSIETLTVRWPSGNEQVFHSVRTDSEVNIVESSDSLFVTRPD